MSLFKWLATPGMKRYEADLRKSVACMTDAEKVTFIKRVRSSAGTGFFLCVYNTVMGSLMKMTGSPIEAILLGLTGLWVLYMVLTDLWVEYHVGVFRLPNSLA